MGGVAAFIGIVFYIGLLVFIIMANWKVYQKAGKPGWACIVPIYNYIVLLEIIKKPLWWLVLLFVPIANIVIAILIMVELAKVFGKTSGFAVGLILLNPIFMAILGFGDAQYIHSQTSEGGTGEALDSMITEEGDTSNS